MSDPASSLAAIIAAIGTLLAGIAAILPLLQKREMSLITPPWRKRLLRSSFRRVTAAVGLVALSFGAGLIAGPAYNYWRVPLNVRITAGAWDALNRGDFASAIMIAQDCIDRFGDIAHAQQTALVADKASTTHGRKPEDKDIRTVIKRGPLNEVAACLYIQGIAAERLLKLDEAKQRYHEVTTFTYARVWNRQGFFWSPSEAAASRLKEIDE
jgi:hypothetical protein